MGTVENRVRIKRKKQAREQKINREGMMKNRVIIRRKG